MHGVAAKIAQEVVVLLLDNNLEPGASNLPRVIQAAGTATGYTDLGLHNALCA